MSSAKVINTSHTLLNYTMALNPPLEDFIRYASTISCLNLNVTTGRGDNLLSLSSLQGNYQRVAYILNNMVSGKGLLNKANKQGWTPLHYAACHHWNNEGNALETVKVLVLAGANIHAKTREKTDWSISNGISFPKGLTALEIANKVGNVDVSQYLAQYSR